MLNRTSDQTLCDHIEGKQVCDIRARDVRHGFDFQLTALGSRKTECCRGTVPYLLHQETFRSRLCEGFNWLVGFKGRPGTHRLLYRYLARSARQHSIDNCCVDIVAS